MHTSSCAILVQSRSILCETTAACLDGGQTAGYGGIQLWNDARGQNQDSVMGQGYALTNVLGMGVSDPSQEKPLGQRKFLSFNNEGNVGA